MILAEVSARNDSGELWRRHYHLEPDGRCWSEGIASGVWNNNRTYASLEEAASDYHAYSNPEHERAEFRSLDIRVHTKLTDYGLTIPAFADHKEEAA